MRSTTPRGPRDLLSVLHRQSMVELACVTGHPSKRSPFLRRGFRRAPAAVGVHFPALCVSGFGGWAKWTGCYFQFLVVAFSQSRAGLGGGGEACQLKRGERGVVVGLGQLVTKHQQMHGFGNGNTRNSPDAILLLPGTFERVR